MDDTDIKFLAYIVSDAFTQPELFEKACQDMAKHCRISEAAAGSAMIAAYGKMLWSDRALQDFLSDYVADKIKDFEIVE